VAEVEKRREASGMPVKGVRRKGRENVRGISFTTRHLDGPRARIGVVDL